MNDDELHDLHDLVALLAVDALTGREREEADAMILDRPELRAELAEMRRALGALAEVERRAPPPRLRRVVLDEVARTPQEPAGDVVAETATPPAAPDSNLAVPDARPPATEAPPAPVVPIERRRRRAWVLAAAAAAVAVLGGGLIASQLASDDELTAADVISADDARTIPMSGELAGFSIVHSPGEGAGVLAGDDLPVPEGDRVYELWAVRDGAAEPVDTFRPDADGDVEVLLPGLDPASADTWAITEEAAGGAEVPTLPILAATA